MKKPEFKATVEVSREWNGEKVAEELVKKLKVKTPNPKFILLFTTIHYEKEFKPILNGIKSAFPDSPLIGGTVAGFITPEGCFTRGVTCLAVDYPNMKVAVDVGKNTRKNPEKAILKISKNIKKTLKKSKWPFGIIFCIPAGPTLPNIKGINKWVVKIPVTNKMEIKLMEISTKTLQKGHGREEEIIKYLSKEFKNYQIISGSSSDNGNVKKNYQFLNNKFYQNSLVLLAIRIDIKTKVDIFHGFHPVAKPFKVTESEFGGKIVCKINGKPAAQKFLEIMNWPEKFFDEKLHRRTFFFPLGFKNKEGYLCPIDIGGILNDNFVFSYSMQGDELIPLTASGYDLLNVLNNSLKKIKKKKLIIACSCYGLLESLGSNIYKIQQILEKKFEAFLLIYTYGESLYEPEREPIHLNESYAIVIF
ncbi:MAG: FIST N-terminal domain-containing protein [Candidatus Aenigmatarchaeota archaeon]